LAKLFDKMKKALREGLEVVKKGTEIIAEKAPEVAIAVAEKTTEAISIGKYKLQIQTVSHKIDRNYSEIGEKVYALIKKKVTQIEADESVKKIVASVDKLKKEIKSVEKKIETMKKQEQEKKNKVVAQPQVKKTAKPSQAKKETRSTGGAKKTKAAEKEEQKRSPTPSVKNEDTSSE